jgi:hypothetical protein
MTASEIMVRIEIALHLALAKHGADMDEDERRAFRLGFLAGTRHGLDAARQEMRAAVKQH